MLPTYFLYKRGIFTTCISYSLLDGRRERMYDLLNTKKGSDLMKYRASKEERAFAESTAKELRRQINDIIVKMDVRQLQKILWTIQKKDR